MNSELFTFLRGVLAAILRLFNSWYIPGTRVTPLSFMILSAFVSFFIAFIKKVTSQDSNITGIVKHFRKGGD